MTNKEYKKACCEQEYYGGSDYLTDWEKTDLRRDIKARKEKGDIVLEGFNHRASIRPVSGGYILTSYYTEVCAVIDGTFRRLWDGYSVTTLKHINLFCDFLGLKGFNKRSWIETKTETI